MDSTTIYDTIKILDTVLVYDTIAIYQSNIDTIKSIMSMHKKDFFDWIMIILPIIPILIASIALWFSKKSSDSAVKSSKIAQKSLKQDINHRKLLVTPHLTFVRQYDIALGGMHILVENVGLGPAKLIKVEIEVNGNKYNSDIQNYMMKVIRDLKFNSPISLASRSMDNGTFIPVGEKRPILKFIGPLTKTAQHEFRKIPSQINYVIHYESIYGVPYEKSLPKDDPSH